VPAKKAPEAGAPGVNLPPLPNPPISVCVDRDERYMTLERALA
jgi:hypothetical protein